MVLGKVQHDIRLHLPHDSAYVFTAEHFSCIGTTAHITALAAYNTANVITDMGITHVSPIGTALQNTSRITGNAAGIRMAAKVRFVILPDDGIDLFYA